MRRPTASTWRSTLEHAIHDEETIMLKSQLQALLLAVSLSAGAALTTTVPATHAEDVKIPATVEDHLALAKEYQAKATEYRKEAQRHRDMFEAYKKSAASSPKNPPPASVVKMQQHCQMLAKDADKLAEDAEKAAEYHTFRARELQGK
jgi:hypothetical protein